MNTYVLKAWIAVAGIGLVGCERQPNDLELRNKAILENIALAYRVYAAEYGGEETRQVLSAIEARRLGILAPLRGKHESPVGTFNKKNIAFIPDGAMKSDSENGVADSWGNPLIIRNTRDGIWKIEAAGAKNYKSAEQFLVKEFDIPER